jgi:hypothetical protein
MAEFNVRDQLTLLELAKRTNFDALQTIVEVLETTEEWLQDAIWLPANQAMSHVTTQRTSVPAGTWRAINEGVSPEASSTKQIEEGIGILEAYSRVDKLLAELSSNPNEFRSGEDKAFIQGLAQELSKVMFNAAHSGATLTIYGDITEDAARFNGLPARLNAMALPTVYDGGANTTTDDTSIYVVQWGPDKVHMCYPKGSPTMGVVHENLGEQTIDVTTTAGTPLLMQALVSHFKIHAGLVVRDDRCIRRIANIRSTYTSGNTMTFASSTSEIHHRMIEALNAMPYQGAGAKIYAGLNVKTQMDIFAVDKTNVNYTIDNFSGKPVTLFRGVPIRRVDAIGIREGSIA